VLHTMPLFVEAILAIGIIYLFWITRKQVTELQELKAVAADTQQPAAGSMDVTMIRNLTTLLTEMQSAVASVRADMVREKEALQKVLVEAEDYAAELRVQLAQSHITDKPRVETSSPMQTPPRVTESNVPAQSLAASAESFRLELEAEGRSERSVKHTMGILHTFSLWLGGHRHEDLTIQHIGARELEAYFDHLWKQGYAPSTVRRKMSLLRKFLDWVKIGASRLDETEETVIHPQMALDANDAAQQPDLILHRGLVDHRQIVLELAKRGLDPTAISSRTGLEREAVRLLLLSQHKERKEAGTHASPRERTFLPMGIGLRYLNPEAVPDVRH
jgi:hypothetical protein